MPTVPTYRPDGVALGPATPAKAEGLGREAFGSAAAAGLGDLGQGLGDAAKLAAAHEDLVAHTAAKDLDTQYADFERDTLWTGENALYKQQGRNALLAAPQVEKALREKAKTLGASGRNPQEQQMFGEVVDRRLASSLDGVARYTAQAEQQDFNDTTLARVTSAQQYAGATWSDPVEQRKQMQAGLADITDLTQRRGWGQEVYRAKALEFTSGAHELAAETMMQAGLIPEARAYVERNGVEMNPQTALGLKGRLRELSTLYGAQAAVGAVEANGVTPSEGGAVPAGAEPARVAAIVQREGGTPAQARVMIAMGLIENGGNPNPANNGSSTGTYQMHPDTFAGVAKKGEDIHNADDNTAAAYRLMVKNEGKLTKLLGRPPQPWELYLMHQQGDGGGPALLTAPREMNAIAALAPAYGGSEAMARKAILGNATVKSGITTSSTVGDFLDMWRDDVAKRLGGGRQAQGGTPATTPSGALPNRSDYVASVVALAPDHDPRTIRAYQAQAEARWSDLKAQKTQSEQDAVDAVQPILQNPNIRTAAQAQAAAGPDLWARLPPTTQTSIMSHYGDGGYAKDSDPVILAGLREMQVSNPKGFAGLDLTGYTGKLSSGDYSGMLKDQGTIRTGGGPAAEHQVTAEKIMGASNALLSAVGLAKAKPGTEQAKQVAQFQQAMFRAVDVFKTRNGGAPPDDKQLQAMADTLLLKGSYDANGSSMFGQVKGVRAFQAPDGHRFTYEVPDRAKKEISAALTKRGKPADQLSIEREYRRLHAAGIYR